VKVAVIGAGIAGNVAARELHREHDVTVFEAGDHVGGHTHTHDVVLHGRTWQVDTGFIVFNDRTYPNFISLLDELGGHVAVMRREVARLVVGERLQVVGDEGGEGRDRDDRKGDRDDPARETGHEHLWRYQDQGRPAGRRRDLEDALWRSTGTRRVIVV